MKQKSYFLPESFNCDRLAQMAASVSFAVENWGRSLEIMGTAAMYFA
jgi:hypothetical protein